MGGLASIPKVIRNRPSPEFDGSCSYIEALTELP